MPKLPRAGRFDSTLSFLSEGYTFASSRFEKLCTDVFETRMMMRKVVCCFGKEAGEMFYVPDRFTRKGALPPTTLRLLQDKGSALTLQGEAHRARKQLFMQVMTPDKLQEIAGLVEQHWKSALVRWEQQDQVVLLDEVREILCRAICEWTGVPLPEEQVSQRTHELSMMIEGAGTVGLRTIRGLALRTRTERWIQNVIREIKNGKISIPDGSPAHVIANHRDHQDKLLENDVAAIELLNLLRPTVAVAWYIVFEALALHENPEWRERLAEGDNDDLHLFVQEVRRFYPFFPFVGGIALENFHWREIEFEKGTWVLFDLYGTNHDARIWQDPNAFRPERFCDWGQSPYSFVPQGGGEHSTSHRCAGEWLTIEVMKAAGRMLVHNMRYLVPEQDLSIDMARMPGRPESGFVISDIVGVS